MGDISSCHFQMVQLADLQTESSCTIGLLQVRMVPRRGFVKQIEMDVRREDDPSLFYAAVD